MSGRWREKRDHVDKRSIEAFDASLRRCDRDPQFLDYFYDRFLASSPKVREKFSKTDFSRQKRMLRASFYLVLLASEDSEHGPERYLDHLAASHSRKGLDIGSELYDLWLDSLLRVVRECDPQWNTEVEDAWEQMMQIGIGFMLERYHHPYGQGS